MPEGPECRRVYEDLHESIGDSLIIELRVKGGRFLKKTPANLANVFLPSKIIDGGVKGKFMWLGFETGSTLWITLGMSGYWSKVDDKHAHFEIVLETGESLYFIDQRRFGTIKFSQDPNELGLKLKQLGIDLLNDSPELHEFKSLMSKRANKTVCEVLMDQRICAGVGNYIKCEVLYRAKISPYRLVKDLSDLDYLNLFTWIKKIMHASYLQGGASIRNYKRVNGEFGTFIFEFEVYAQKIDPLGNQVVREETPDGRTTHWVPSEQS